MQDVWIVLGSISTGSLKIMRENNIFFRQRPGFSLITSRSAPMWLITEVDIKSDTEKKAEKEKVGTKRFRINRFVALFQQRHFYSQLYGYFSRIYWASDWTQNWFRISHGCASSYWAKSHTVLYSVYHWAAFINNRTTYHWLSELISSTTELNFHSPCDELFTQRWLKGDLDFFLWIRHFSSVFIPVFGWRPSYSAELYLPLGCNVIYKYEACFSYIA